MNWWKRLTRPAAMDALLESLVSGVSPLDAGTFAMTLPVLLAAAMAASFVPARRASRVNPIRALRQE